MSSNPLLSRSSNFSRRSVFFWNFMKLTKSVRSGSVNAAWGVAVNWALGDKKIVLYVASFAY